MQNSCQSFTNNAFKVAIESNEDFTTLPGDCLVVPTVADGSSEHSIVYASLVRCAFVILTESWACFDNLLISWCCGQLLWSTSSGKGRKHCNIRFLRWNAGRWLFPAPSFGIYSPVIEIWPPPILPFVHLLPAGDIRDEVNVWRTSQAIRPMLFSLSESASWSDDAQRKSPKRRAWQLSPIWCGGKGQLVSCIFADLPVLQPSCAVITGQSIQSVRQCLFSQSVGQHSVTYWAEWSFNSINSILYWSDRY